MAKTQTASANRGAVGFKGAGFDSDAPSTEALQRTGRPAFCDVQLLPKTHVFGTATRARPIRESSGRSAFQTCVPVDRLCGDAGARTLAIQRTREAHAIKRVTRSGREARVRADGVAILSDGDGCAGFLAEAILRLQCVESQEES